MKKFISVLFVMLILMISIVPAFALESPQASTSRHQIIIVPVEGGGADYDIDTEYDEDGNEIVVIKPNPKPGYEFIDFEIEGDYEIIEVLEDGTIKIKVKGDIKVTPIYKDKTSGSVATGTVNTDDSSKSPQTGSNEVIPYAVIILSVAACGIATLKLVKSK